MKFLGIILSIYFLGLNFVPCADIISDDTDTDCEIVVKNDHTQNNHIDMCSPFCQCNCCQVHIAKFKTPSFEIVETIIASAIPETGEDWGDDIANYHFQPPRL